MPQESAFDTAVAAALHSRNFRFGRTQEEQEEIQRKSDNEFLRAGIAGYLEAVGMRPNDLSTRLQELAASLESDCDNNRTAAKVMQEAATAIDMLFDGLVLSHSNMDDTELAEHTIGLSA